MIITVLDIGNTNIGWAIFNQDSVMSSGYGGEWENDESSAIVVGANVGIPQSVLKHEHLFVLSKYKKILYDKFDIPVNIGFDRAANLYGAKSLLKSNNFAVIDCGSANTITVMRDGKFAGGAISLGLGKSKQAVCDYFPALADYIIKPYNFHHGAFDIYTYSDDAVNMGILSMQVAYINAYIKKLNDLKISDIVLTGGDAEIIYQYLDNKSLRQEKLLTILGYKQEHDFVRTIA